MGIFPIAIALISLWLIATIVETAIRAGIQVRTQQSQSKLAVRQFSLFSLLLLLLGDPFAVTSAAKPPDFPSQQVDASIRATNELSA